HVFTFFATPGPVTCFQGINCLLPGHYLVVRPQGTPLVEERVYWEIDFPNAGEEERRGFRRFASNAANPVVDEFQALMRKGVERRLRADVPVVSYLSGGVDSSLVVAMACAQRRREGKGPIPTFTVSVQDPGFNEETEAALVARHVEAKQTIVVDYGRDEVLAT